MSNGATTLDVASVSISLDGNKLDQEVSEGTWVRESIWTQEGATYSITASASGLESGSEHTVSATLTDSAGATTTHEATFTVTDVLIFFADSATVKYIEVEDFNYDGGSYKTFEEVGTGGSYEGLGAVSGIDFNNSGNASEKYRVIPGNHPGMTESMWDAGRSGFDMEVDFKMGWNDDGDWYNYTRDFPEGGSYAVYGRFSSGGAAVDAKLSIVTGDATAEEQATEDVGTFKGPATGGWDTMKFFPLQDDSGALAVVELSGVSTVRLTKVAGNMDANYLAFVPYAGSDDPVDISMPGDAVVPTSDNHPAGEHAGLAVANNPSPQSLSFDGANNTASGLTITTGGGVVTGLGLTSANDAPDRDPSSFVLSGSNDGGATFAEIATGDIPAFGARFERRTVSFDNSTAYTTYQLIYPTTAGPSTCCMQIAEIELLGTAAGGDAPAPVSHWNFDDGQTVTDQVGANDGTVLKNVTFSTDTPDGSAHSIDLTGKNNYVRIGEASPGGPTFGIEETSSFTISAWVKYESSERGIVTVRQDLTSGGGDRSGMTLGINANGNPFVGMIPCCNSPEFRDITTNQEVPTGTWTHLAATYDSDSDTLAVYVNGEAATGYTSNSAESPADDGSNATGGIGGFDWTDTNGSFTGFGAAGNAPAHGSSAGDFTRLFYSGLLDEVAIWSQALNADQIAGLAGSGAAGPAISVVNNGDGTVTVTFEGTLQSAPTVNGPWSDVDGASPLTIPADQAAQFGRAKN